ncbi:unnamed protein product [Adineta ricciae]|uniref:Uncharacterized protein n=2 Tax=Adineta ricciae TaxID=249248 RepID=A0A815RDD3_ADIRI|nr:unnamed protein product [Adineta ricciae]
MTTVTPHAESELTITSKVSPQLFSSSNENSNQVHSLPINSHRPHSPSSSQALTSCVDPLTQSYSSIRSIHSDSSLNPSLINTKAPSSNPNPGTTSLNSSLHLQRNTPSSNTNQSQRSRTGQHRRNLNGRATIHRDRKNSFTKSNTNKLDEQSTTNSCTRIEYQHLFPVIGHGFTIGKGYSIFDLPDLQGRIVIRRNPCGNETDYASKVSIRDGQAKHILIIDDSSSFSLRLYRTLDYIIFNGQQNSNTRQFTQQICCCSSKATLWISSFLFNS